MGFSSHVSRNNSVTSNHTRGSLGPPPSQEDAGATSMPECSCPLLPLPCYVGRRSYTTLLLSDIFALRHHRGKHRKRDVRRESVSSTVTKALLHVLEYSMAAMARVPTVQRTRSSAAQASAPQPMQSSAERPPYGTDDQIAPGRYPRYLAVHVSSVEEYLRNTYVIRGQATTDTHVGTLIKTHFPTAQR